MSTSLLGLQIGSSYSGLLKFGNNAAISGVLRAISDGLGTDSALLLSTAGVKSSGTFEAVGAATFGAGVAATGAVTGSNLSGTNTGDQVNITGNAATVTTNANLTGDVTSVGNATTLGTVPIAKGGTGKTSANLARNALNVGETALTDAATIATDCSLGNIFTVTLGGNRTLGYPSNQVAGATYIWRITQDGGGSRTLACHAAFKFPGGIAPVMTTTGSAVDIISGVSNGTYIYCSFLPNLS